LLIVVDIKLFTMKIKLTILIAILTISISSFAQVWTLQPSGITTILRDIFFITPHNGWAVGDQNVILVTNDGGSTWAAQNSIEGTGITYTSVFFTSVTKGWIVGSKETILSTENGGNTWNVITNTNGQIDYKDVYFATPDSGFIVGRNGASGIIKRTSDGGTTWQTATVSRGLDDVHLTSGLKGWACGTLGVIFNTIDGGVNWIEQKPAGANQTADLGCIFMISETEGWAGGNPSSFYQTTDGGNTWGTIASGTNAGKTDIYFLNSQEGWAITTSPLGGGFPIRHTIDGGSNWTVDTTNLPILYGLKFYNDTLGWVVGERGKILRLGTPPPLNINSPTLTDDNYKTYPNPVQDYLFITSEEPINCAEIMNVSGQRLMVLKEEDIDQIRVSQLHSGSYSLILTTSKGNQVVKRFLKSD
jgi:photosystem II stability/assembly factor-like uncharacterized protein